MNRRASGGPARLRPMRARRATDAGRTATDPSRLERLPGLLDTALCAAWAAAAGAAIENARARGLIDAGWSPTSSSLRLRALPGVDAGDARAAVWTPVLAAACARIL